MSKPLIGRLRKMTKFSARIVRKRVNWGSKVIKTTEMAASVMVSRSSGPDPVAFACRE